MIADIIVLANGNSKWVRDVNRIVSGYPYRVTLKVFFDLREFKAATDDKGKVALVSSYFYNGDTSKWLASNATIRLYVVGDLDIVRIERSGAHTKVTMDEMTSVLILEDLKLASSSQPQIQAAPNPRREELQPLGQSALTSVDPFAIKSASSERDRKDNGENRGDSRDKGADDYQKINDRVEKSYTTTDHDAGAAEVFNPTESESTPTANGFEINFLDIAKRWQILEKGAPTKGSSSQQSQPSVQPRPHANSSDRYFDGSTEAKFAEYLASSSNATHGDPLAGALWRLDNFEGGNSKTKWESEWTDQRAINDDAVDPFIHHREYRNWNMPEGKGQKKDSELSTTSIREVNEPHADGRATQWEGRSDSPLKINGSNIGSASNELRNDMAEDPSSSKGRLGADVGKGSFGKKLFADSGTTDDRGDGQHWPSTFKSETAFEEPLPWPIRQGQMATNTDAELPQLNTPERDHRKSERDQHTRTGRVPNPPQDNVDKPTDDYQKKGTTTISQDPHAAVNSAPKEEKSSLLSRIAIFKARSLNSEIERNSWRVKPFQKSAGRAEGNSEGSGNPPKSILKYRLGSGNLGEDLKFKGEEPLGLAIGVLGVGGSGASTIAMAVAQSFAGEHRVNLIDLVVEGSQRMYHDIDIVQPGVAEAIAGSRVMNVGDDYFERFKIPILERGYLLMLSISHQSQLEALRRRDLGEAVERIKRTSDITIFDLDPDFATEPIREWATITPTAPTEEVLREIDAVIIVVNEDYRSLHRGVNLGRRLIDEGFSTSQIAVINNDNHQSTPSSIRQIRKLPELLQEYGAQRQKDKVVAVDPARSLHEDAPNGSRGPVYIDVPYSKEVAKIHEEVRPFPASFLKKLQPVIQFCANARSFTSERTSTSEDFPLVRPQRRNGR